MTPSSVRSVLRFATPEPWKRAALGIAVAGMGLVFVAAAALEAGLAGTTSSPLQLLADKPFVLPLLLIGLGIAGTNHLVTLDRDRRRVSRGWRWFGLPLHPPRQADLSSLDHIVVARRALPVSSPNRRGGPVVRQVYPVWFMSRQGYLDHLLGWSPDYLDRVNRGPVRLSRPPNYAVFLRHARHLGATAAAALGVPLVDEVSGQRFPPREIPHAWLDPTSVVFDSRIDR